MKIKVLRLLIGLAIGSLLIAGCASPVATTAPPEPAATEAAPTQVAATTAPESTTAPEPTAAAEPVKIGVYTVAWSPTDQAMVAQLIDLFNQEHAGRIEAEFIQGDWGELNTYVSAGVTGGGGIADVVENGNWGGGALDWYEQGFILDLRPYITDEIRATMPEELWAARTASDGAIFMGGTVTGQHLVIYYNPALLAQAGIEPPPPDGAWTWDEFMENAQKLTLDANGKHLGEGGFDSSNVVQWGFMPRLDNEKVWEEGGNLAMQATGRSLVRKGDDGSWDIFFDDATLPALQSYLGVVEAGITPETAIGLTGDSQDEAFAQGQAAMVMRAYFNIPVLRDKYPGFEFGVMATPREPSATAYYVDTVGQGFMVPVTSQHPAEAAEFVFWLQQAQPDALRASSLFLAPVNPDAESDPVLKENPDWSVMSSLEAIKVVVPVEGNTNLDEFLTTLYAPNMIAVVQGDKTFDEAIAEIKAGAKDILNQ